MKKIVLIKTAVELEWYAMVFYRLRHAGRGILL